MFVDLGFLYVAQKIIFTTGVSATGRLSLSLPVDDFLVLG